MEQSNYAPADDRQDLGQMDTPRQELTVPRPRLATGGALSPIVPTNIEEAFRLATAIVTAGMAPRGINTAEQALIAILHGMEVGLLPMQAIQSTAVINGVPSLYGDAPLAIVYQSGYCEWVKEWMEGEGDSRVAYCEAKRKGNPTSIVRSFSVEQAKQAGLWDTRAKVRRKAKNGGHYEVDNDAPWHRYPERMLQFRARGFALRDAFSDALKGFKIAAVEELEYGARQAVQAAEAEEPKSVNPFVDDEMDADGAIDWDAEEIDPETGELLEQVAAE